ncbi:unnamed protein product [Owenia fusiformis]|uniref:BRCA1-associated ATM activator 1 n=1 Tax=Owenia fusiformis TaxID=6347 RepID=A0A8S4PPN3_OWEFU|nr:unnamed protein product [Owenia fusiformis]
MPSETGSSCLFSALKMTQNTPQTISVTNSHDTSSTMTLVSYCRRVLQAFLDTKADIFDDTCMDKLIEWLESFFESSTMLTETNVAVQDLQNFIVNDFLVAFPMKQHSSSMNTFNLKLISGLQSILTDTGYVWNICAKYTQCNSVWDDPSVRYAWLNTVKSLIKTQSQMNNVDLMSSMLHPLKCNNGSEKDEVVQKDLIASAGILEVIWQCVLDKSMFVANAAQDLLVTLLQHSNSSQNNSKLNNGYVPNHQRDESRMRSGTDEHSKPIAAEDDPKADADISNIHELCNNFFIEKVCKGIRHTQDKNLTFIPLDNSSTDNVTMIRLNILHKLGVRDSVLLVKVLEQSDAIHNIEDSIKDLHTEATIKRTACKVYALYVKETTWVNSLDFLDSLRSSNAGNVGPCRTSALSLAVELYLLIPSCPESLQPKMLQALEDAINEPLQLLLEEGVVSNAQEEDAKMKNAVALVLSGLQRILEKGLYRCKATFPLLVKLFTTLYPVRYQDPPSVLNNPRIKAQLWKTIGECLKSEDVFGEGDLRCLLTTLLSMLEGSEMTSHEMMSGLTVAQLTIRKLTCQLKEPISQNSYLLDAEMDEQIAKMLQKCLCAVDWSIRDSAVKLIKDLMTGLGNEMMLKVCGCMKNYGIISTVYGSLKDGESYVRSTTLATLSHVVENTGAWSTTGGENTGLWSCFLSQVGGLQEVLNDIFKIIREDTEAVARRPAVTCLTTIYRCNICNSVESQEMQNIRESVYQCMADAMDDFDWEVKMNSLLFWETVLLDVTKEKVHDIVPSYAAGLFPPPKKQKIGQHFDKTEHVHDADDVQRAIRNLCENGCLGALLSGVRDYESQVVIKACQLIQKFRIFIEVAGITRESLKQLCQYKLKIGNMNEIFEDTGPNDEKDGNTQNITGSNDIASNGVNIETKISENDFAMEMSQTIQKLLEVDVDRTLTELEGVDYIESPMSLLQDILASLEENQDEDKHVDCY